MAKNGRLGGIMLSLLCALLWSTAGFFIKLVPWNPLALAGWRGLVGGLVLLAFMLLTKRKIVFTGRSAVIGVLVALTSLLFVTANKLTTATNAIVLQYTAPIFLIIISVLLFKKRFKRADYIAVALTMGGIVLFFVDKLTLGGMLGNVLALADGACLAAVYVLTGESGENARLSGIMLGGGFTFLLGAPISLLHPAAGSALLSGPFKEFFLPLEVSGIIILAVIAMGLTQIALPYILYSFALRSCPPLLFTLIGSVEIILNPVWVLLLVGEKPGIWALAGSIVIIATITVWCALDARKKEERA